MLHKEGDRLWLKPVDKRERRDMQVSDAGGAEAGDLVLAEKAGRPPRVMARVVERLGDPFAPRSFSLVAIHKFDLPHTFTDEALEEAAKVSKDERMVIYRDLMRVSGLWAYPGIQQ